MINLLISFSGSCASYIADNPVLAWGSSAVAIIASLGVHYQVRKRQSLADLQTSRQMFDRSFAGIPQEERWRLFIDWNRQDGGAMCFDEKEPGYKAGMEKAFSSLRDTLRKKLDADEYMRLHDLCVDDVRNDKGPFKKGFYAGREYRFCSRYHEAIPSELAASKEEHEAALKEAYEKGLFSGYPKDKPDYRRFLAHHDDWSMRSLSSCSVRETKNRINGLIKIYYQRIGQAETDKEKIASIVDLCKELEIYHVGYDGNQRNVSFVLLQKLLLENGFAPVILENPVMFDGYCTTEKMVRHVEMGQKRFARLVEHYQSSKNLPPRDQIDTGISLKRVV